MDAPEGGLSRSRAVEIGQRAGYFQHPVIAPGRKPHPFRRLDEKPAPVLVRHRDLVQHLAVGVGVGANGFVSSEPFEALFLNRAGGGDAGRDIGGAFGGRRQVQIGGVDGGNVDAGRDDRRRFRGAELADVLAGR